MPELPEVETVKEILKAQIISKKIKDIKIYYDKIIQNVKTDEFKVALIGKTIKDITRYGKYLIIIFDDVTLVSHLRMEGKYFIKDICEKVESHEHIIFEFDDNTTLRYHDTRKFGTMDIINSTNIQEILEFPSIKKLGKEANDETLTGLYLYKKISKLNSFIKVALLDQTNIAGLGNIYVDEVLFKSKFHPKKLTNTLTLGDCNTLVKYSKEILNKAISEGGTTIRSYTSSLGVTGRFQQSLHVHTLEGKECDVCKTKIVKKFVGGRGSYYCPKCQKKDKYVIGLTGSISSGKSTTSNYLKMQGYQVIDADVISRTALDIGKTPYKKAIELFGEKILNSDLTINRKSVKEEIFNNESLRVALNNIIHPYVIREIKKAINNSKEKLIFLDVALLFESKIDEMCDIILVVDILEEIQIQRLVKRDNVCAEFAKKQIDSQMPLSKKVKLADFVLTNNTTSESLYQQIDDVLKTIKEKLI